MIVLQADSSRWEAQLKAQFGKLEQRLQGGMIGVLKDTHKVIESEVDKKRTRPEAHLGHAGLSAAILAATYVNPQFASMTLGDAKILDHLAIYWHAIEVGSDHIVGHKIFGFDGPNGIQAASPSRAVPPQDSVTVSATDARNAGITPNQFRVVANPITPHHILEDVSAFLVARYTQEVSARFTEALQGIPYKRQVRGS